MNIVLGFTCKGSELTSKIQELTSRVTQNNPKITLLEVSRNVPESIALKMPDSNDSLNQAIGKTLV